MSSGARLPADVPTNSVGEPDLVSYCQSFITEYVDDLNGYGSGLSSALQSNASVVEVDLSELTQWDHEFVDYALDRPEEVREAFATAFETHDSIPGGVSFTPDVHFANLGSVPEPERYVVGGYGSDDCDHLRVVEGQVARVAQSKGIFTEICFRCQRCSTETTIPQEFDDLQMPHECVGCERQGPFERVPEESTEHDFQLIRLQRPPEHARSGTQPDKIDVIAKSDLVGTVTPGDRIQAAVKLERSYDDDTPTFTIRGEALGIEHQESDFEDIDYDEYMDEIEELAADPNVRGRIVDSIKPSHRGDSHIKSALALQIFGGVKKDLPDGSLIRGTPHVLLVGDPGTDKSGLAHYMTELAPRSVYTSGKNATAAGLTCAAVQSDFGDGGWTLQAGALVEADGGLCAIDEFDKVDEEEREGVHEALANGTISPSKAGITNVSLPAEATVLACANPVHGRFDEFEPIGEQIDLGPTLLSRFDLIFVMTDKPDVDEDAALAEHMLESARVGQERAADEHSDAGQDTVTPEIDPEVLRAYIAYAKEHCAPRLTDDAKDRLKGFYTSIRASGEGDDNPVPTTPRTIQALVRLAEAAARMRLSNEVTLDDAEHAIEIVERSLNDVGVDPETGEFDADVVETGSSKAQRDRVQDLLDTITEVEGEEPADEGKILSKMAEKGYSRSKVSDELQKQADRGEIYSPAGQGWRNP